MQPSNTNTNTAAIEYNRQRQIQDQHQPNQRPADDHQDEDKHFILARYLEQIQAQYEHIEWPRTNCIKCGASRHVYCFDCCLLLIPREDWPNSIRRNYGYNHPHHPSNDGNHYQQEAVVEDCNNQCSQEEPVLPFHLDIILRDRRPASTGVQLATLLGGATGGGEPYNLENSGGVPPYLHETNPQQRPSIRLFDIDQGHVIPKYNNQNNNKNDVDDHDSPEQQPNLQTKNNEDSIPTVLLYPGPQSIALSSWIKEQNETEAQEKEKEEISTITRRKMFRLVVLDCKWTICKRVLELFSNLPMVHLDNPPSQSYYWRWHNSGPGCLSTAEAVFWAAWKIWKESHPVVDDDDHHHVRDNGTIHAGHKNTGNPDDTAEESRNNKQQQQRMTQSLLENTLWLFAIQRSIILRRFHAEVEERTIPHLPFTDQAKEEARNLRRRQNVAASEEPTAVESTKSVCLN